MRNERVITIWGFLSLSHSVRGLLTFRHAQWMCYRNVGQFLFFHIIVVQDSSKPTGIAGKIE